MKQKKKNTTISKVTPSLHRLIRDMTSQDYHGSIGWSSSQLKDILDDEELFIDKYIKKTVERQQLEAFDTGTYFHTGLLEPHKLNKELAVFPGKVRYGKAWDNFKAANSGKIIVSEKQKAQAEGMIKAVENSPVSMGYLEGEPEVSLYTELVVVDDRVYAPAFGKEITPWGWTYSKNAERANGFRAIVKVRADCLGETFISDLKSTSGRANQQHSVRNSISKYKYDLSAALYLDMFSLINEDISAFIWIFASKENHCAASWLATEKQIRVGRGKWRRALKRLADLAQANWEIPDYLREAEPLPHELEWLIERDTDLL